jgi:uncharacterized small protein (DUF1192 family)
MDTDDLEPPGKPNKPKDLEIMSVEALQEYIAELKAEIARAEAQVAAKQDHRKAADAFFKS